MSKLGLPIADGNEWNTGGSNPFNPVTHWSATAGSHHPNNFEPFETYSGGTRDIHETPYNPTTFAVDLTPNADVRGEVKKTLNGGDTATAAAGNFDIMQFIIDHKLVVGAGLLLVLFVIFSGRGKK